MTRTSSAWYFFFLEESDKFYCDDSVLPRPVTRAAASLHKDKGKSKVLGHHFFDKDKDSDEEECDLFYLVIHAN